LHNEELHDFYSSPKIIWMIKENKMGEACSMYVGKEKQRVLVGKYEKRQPLGRSMHR
jgi:DNA relaxase NicK